MDNLLRVLIAKDKTHRRYTTPITFVRDWISIYSGETVENLREQYGDILLLSPEEGMKIIQQREQEKFCSKDRREVTKEERYNLYECLPPAVVERNDSGFYFCCMECLAWDIYTRGKQHKGKFYFASIGWGANKQALNNFLLSLS